MSITSSPVNPSTQLRIESTWLSPGVVQMAVVGEIDLATTEELQANLLSLILTGLPRRIEVDLAGVTFMDCSGLSVLVAARHAAARAGCRLQITKPQPIVRHVLEMTGLLGILTSPSAGRRPRQELIAVRNEPAGHTKISPGVADSDPCRKQPGRRRLASEGAPGRRA